MLRGVAPLALAAGVAGHGAMHMPKSRNSVVLGVKTDLAGPSCAGGSCLWFSQGCQIGCPDCTGAGGPGWVGKLCRNVGEPTITKPEHRTYNIHAPSGSARDYTKHNPWRAPGTAPVKDPCGVAGGNAKPGRPGNGGFTPPGARRGEKGSSLPAIRSERTVWTAGSTAEVAWGIMANHGGGYQYRLCPKGQEADEICFQKMPLAFVGSTQWIRHGTDPTKPHDKQTAINATYVTEGTTPSGSMWAKNPVPPCDDPEGGAFGTLCMRKAFPEPAPGVGGFGAGACLGLPTCLPGEMMRKAFHFSIVDKVQVPEGLRGEYVVGFRWDGEQTPQVWQSCSDVTIE